MTLDLNRIPNTKIGYCQDPICDYEPEQCLVTFVRYIETRKGPAWICEGCLEQWSDTLEEYTDNVVDLDLPEAYPFIP